MINTDNVAGVHLPIFKQMEDSKGPARTTGVELTGLSKGGTEIKKSREFYLKALDALIQLASLQVTRRIKEKNISCFILFQNIVLVFFLKKISILNIFFWFGNLDGFYHFR
jgi:hypothetical protein